MGETLISLLVISVGAALLLGLLFGRDHHKRRSKHTVMEYQRAVYFRSGCALHDVGPGVHKVLLGRDFIVHGDVRPISVSIENSEVGIKGHAFARYSFFANVEVENFHKAMYSSRNFSELPFYITRRDVRAAISTKDRDTLSNRTAIEKSLEMQIRQNLQSVGFELREFKLAQLQVFEAPPKSEKDVTASPKLLN